MRMPLPDLSLLLHHPNGPALSLLLHHPIPSDGAANFHVLPDLSLLLHHPHLEHPQHMFSWRVGLNWVSLLTLEKLVTQCLGY